MIVNAMSHSFFNNGGHNTLRLDVLPNFSFATCETEHNF